MKHTGLSFGLFFFGCLPTYQTDPYELVLAATAAADRIGLSFVSTPERHFNRFGGAFPAPAVLSAALAALTKSIQIRAGSVITPLHDVVRVVEDWSVVDNLSNGRCAISIGSGWSVNDFILADRHRYVSRKSQVLKDIDAIRRLWKGEYGTRQNAVGQPFKFTTYPKPISEQLPIWLTTGGSDDAFDTAGRQGLNVLTHLERQSVTVLADRIAIFRRARAEVGLDPDSGIVTLMQHTHICPTGEGLNHVQEALRQYLLASLTLEEEVIGSGGTSSGGSPISLLGQATADEKMVFDLAVDRYMTDASLIGPEEECMDRCNKLTEAGVNEIACLVDFMPNRDNVLVSVQRIAKLAHRLQPRTMEATRSNMIANFNELPSDSM